MPLRLSCFTQPSKDHIPLELVSSDNFKSWLDQQAVASANWAEVQGWKAQLGQTLKLPNETGGLEKVAIGLGTQNQRQRLRFGAVKEISKLPGANCYALKKDTPSKVAQEFLLGCMLESYVFNKYRSVEGNFPAFAAHPNVDATAIEAIARGEALTRDLINTPSSDMGPEELEIVARELSERHSGQMNLTKGEALLSRNFPMIHTVGRASVRAPRLIELNFGQEGPRICLVGKGVCFDTGGLNIKPGASMGLMKKDMGGAAHVLGLAEMILTSGWPVQLRVLIPAVENAIGGSAFRPQDILTSRKGLTVEINNTDAEGRLVLADALAYADEDPADVTVCMATLTGAARVAVGPDIAPYFTDNETLSSELAASAAVVSDPVWRLPFHAPYESMIEPGIADLDNAPKGGFAGAITAAMFLRRFVENSPNFIHFDCYGWQPIGAPARPSGGVGQGTRALFDALPRVLKL